LRQKLDVVQLEALTDTLTGLANRKMFDIAVRQASLESTETKQPMCLLLLDIDFFKAFNDTFGHQLGDEVLKLVAHTLKEVPARRKHDIRARYGGEEFAIVLPRTPLARALEFAERTRRRIASKKVVHRRTQESLGSVTLSIGVARFQPGEALAKFIARADAALYAAKRNGRNRVVSEADLVRLAAHG
jgi:diguanylate cyclase